VSRRPPDFELWAEVAKTVKPLRGPGRSRSAVRTSPEPKPHAPRVSAPHVQVPRNLPQGPPPITGFDRRTSQKLLRGNVEIERRLDLHGSGIEVARERLYRFLVQSREEGLRTVLVITGKGDSPYARHTLHGTSHFHADERQGRLRRLLGDWLHEAQFRELVSGYQPAHPRHGGGGAFYIRLRRLRGDS
jgi:DNA-nicking Smr family endonuclease